MMFRFLPLDLRRGRSPVMTTRLILLCWDLMFAGVAVFLRHAS
jgi:hypothetical protein